MKSNYYFVVAAIEVLEVERKGHHELILFHVAEWVVTANQEIARFIIGLLFL